MGTKKAADLSDDIKRSCDIKCRILLALNHNWILVKQDICKQAVIRYVPWAVKSGFVIVASKCAALFCALLTWVPDSWKLLSSQKSIL